MRIIRLVPLIILLFPLDLSAQMLLDSTVTYNYSSDQDSIRNRKKEYLYNASGQAVAESDYEWSPEKDIWLTAFRSEYAYDNHGNWNTNLTYYADSSKKGWILHAKREKQFNEVGELILQTDSWWNPGQSMWEPGLKLEITFTDNDTVIVKTETTYNWSSDLQNWFPLERFEERLNTAGKLIERTYASGKNSQQQWNWFYKEQYERDESGNTILMMTLRKYGNQDSWTPEFKAESTYSHSGLRLTLVSSAWDDPNQAWKPLSKMANIYNTHRDIINTYDYDWNELQNKWVLSQGDKYQLFYDSNDSLYLSRHSYLNPFQEWSEDRQSEYKYITSIKGYLYLDINYVWDSHINHYGWQPVTRHEKFIYADGTVTYEGWYTPGDGDGEWDCSGKEFNYYSFLSTGIDEKLVEKILIYPNPTDGILTITGYLKPVDIQIYSTLGQMIRSENRVENSLDISGLPAGIYFMVVIDGNTMIDRERIIKR